MQEVDFIVKDLYQKGTSRQPTTARVADDSQEVLLPPARAGLSSGNCF